MADVRAQDDDLFMLTDDKQLLKLAKLLRNQEEPLMLGIKSEPDRIKFLQECNDSYDNVVTLLDISRDLRNKHEAARAVSEEKADIAANIEDYVKYGINMSLQCVRNCGFRLMCVEKLKEHFDDLATDLNMLDAKNTSNVESLAKEVAFYKQSMLEYANNIRSGTARAHSKAYSMGLKQEGIEFPNLVNRHKNRLGYKDEFEFLEEDQKLEVYNSIIRESGRANIPIATRDTLGGKAGGIASLAMSASMMVWDIFSAEHKLESVVSTAVSVLADVGAFAVQVAVNAAVTTAVANLELGVFAVSVAGFVAGALTGVLFAVATGALLGLIFGTGGKVPPNLDGLKFYSATMPDGMALANELSHG
ncbi:hypothetical protein BVRB_8g181910 [Beta vulgaris subsp. vulgaris]|nr:hypothetical protein BVRB_8g181910 [Beta vulgaris subsp. vulgaris]